MAKRGYRKRSNRPRRRGRGVSLVFRIQDAEGRGPWRPGFSETWIEDRPEHENLKPFFEEFGLNIFGGCSDGKHFGCGCISLDQLKLWFTKGEYETLLKHGYKCVSMKAKILRRSAIQCVFSRSRPLNNGVTEVKLY